MPKTTFFNLHHAKRRRFLDIALEEFATQPYAKVSISRIANRSGIAKGSVYQYFEDKRDLYFFLLELAAAEKNAFIRHEPHSPDEDLFARLRRLFTSGLEFQFSNPHLAQISYRAIYESGPLLEETKERLRQSSLNFFRELIEEGMARGQIDGRLDPELAAFFLNQVFAGFGDFLLGRMALSPERLAAGETHAMDQAVYWQSIDHLLAILRHGLQSTNE